MPDRLLEKLDALVAEGRYANRAAAVRDALERLIADDWRREIDRQIIDGYARKPPPAFDAFTRALARGSIEQEPW